MATQLTIVNNVLRRLREDEVTSVVDNTYSKLIAQFVNDAKADIEDYNHEWSVYMTEIDTTILNDGTRTYDLTATNDRSWLMRDPDHDTLPLAFDITSGSIQQLQDISYKELKYNRALSSSSLSETKPTHFAVVADSDGRGWTIELLWQLDSSESSHTWRTYWYVPQAELSLTGSDDSTEILLPSRCIELRALFYALNERGEEMGVFGGVADKRSTDAIAAAMEVDATIQKKLEELDVTNVENI